MKPIAMLCAVSALVHVSLSGCSARTADEVKRAQGLQGSDRHTLIMAIGTDSSTGRIVFVREDRLQSGDTGQPLCDSTGIYLRGADSSTALTQPSERLCDLLWSGPAPSVRKGLSAIATADIFDSNRVMVVTFDQHSTKLVKTDCRLGAAAPAWSPDGRRLAIVGTCDSTHARQALHLLRVGHGSEGSWNLRRRVAERVPLTWAPDAKRLAFAGGAAPVDSIYTIELVTGQIRAIAQGSEPSWSPTGERIAYVRRNKSELFRTDIRFVNPLGTIDSSMLAPESPSRVGTPDGFVAPSPLVWTPDGTRIYYSSVKCIESIEVESRRHARVFCALR